MSTDATDTPPAPLHRFEHTPGGATHTCTTCRGQFHAHVVATHYSTTGLQPGDKLPTGQHTCPTCLAAATTRIAQAIAGLDLIAEAVGGHEQVLGLAQQVLSQIRKAAHNQAGREICAQLYGPGHPDPTVVEVGHEPICDGSDLYASAYLYNGQPRLDLVDSGGWRFADLDIDAARQMVQQINDLIDVAEMAAQL
ncbi:conserved hypothetical protein [Frankia sp. Hr75.2]|nr:conserved hypothetical protein [Frankia sp. Hr75.2]